MKLFRKPELKALINGNSRSLFSQTLIEVLASIFDNDVIISYLHF